MHPIFPSPHSNFFSSLKQVEKRLKLESPSSSSAVSQPPPPSPTLTEKSTETGIDSLSTPIYLHCDQPSVTTISTLQESEAPREFLLNSPDFPPTQKAGADEDDDSGEEAFNAAETYDVDDIQLLMELLGLSSEVEGHENPKRGGVDFGCDDEFYRKIVGVKGPKSLKELERMEGWIKHFGAKEIKEPLRLAHLLLGKAAFLHSLEGDDDEFGGLKFPSTIDEFLLNDPPID